MSALRTGTAGATRTCPHCKATILESSAVCPACRGHLKFDAPAVDAAQRVLLRRLHDDLDRLVEALVLLLHLGQQPDAVILRAHRPGQLQLGRLRRLGIGWFMGHDSSKFRITESVFRFGADVRAGDDPREAQLRMIRDGEAMALENRLQLNDENEENQPDSGEEE